MKKLLTILILSSICVIFIGCANTTTDIDNVSARKICNFMKIFNDIDVGFGLADQDIFVDMNTGVLYIRIWRSGFSPIYNEDGSLKIWKGEIPE